MQVKYISTLLNLNIIELDTIIINIILLTIYEYMTNITWKQINEYNHTIKSFLTLHHQYKHDK